MDRGVHPVVRLKDGPDERAAVDAELGVRILLPRRIRSRMAIRGGRGRDGIGRAVGSSAFEGSGGVASARA
jgi:hypothetical protein